MPPKSDTQFLPRTTPKKKMVIRNSYLGKGDADVFTKYTWIVLKYISMFYYAAMPIKVFGFGIKIQGLPMLDHTT